MFFFEFRIIPELLFPTVRCRKWVQIAVTEALHGVFCDESLMSIRMCSDNLYTIGICDFSEGSLTYCPPSSVGSAQGSYSFAGGSERHGGSFASTFSFMMCVMVMLQLLGSSTAV